MLYPKFVNVRDNTKYTLPINGIIMREETSFPDQDGRLHVVYIIRSMTKYGEFIYQAFDTTTHEYLGDVSN